MSILQSMTDWTKCFICQKKTKEKLKSTDEGRKNALSIDIKHIQIQGQDLEITLNNSNASYHHSYNSRMYKRQLEKENRRPNLKTEDIFKKSPN